MSRFLAVLGARLVRFTYVVDRAYLRFDQMRSWLVLAFAPEAFHHAYGEIAYDATSTYRAGADDFRHGLFTWEERAIDGSFPRPPARILIGGAGGGREAFALVERGYDVVAFEPAPRLARSMENASISSGGKLQAFRGGYGDLPFIRPAGGGDTLNLGRLPRFEAAILGWASFSHLTSDRERVRTLQQIATLTNGPILVSFFLSTSNGHMTTGRRWLAPLRRRAARWGDSVFTVGMGYTRLLTEAELRELAAQAGLIVASMDSDSKWPNAVLARAGRAGRAGGAGEAGGVGRLYVSRGTRVG